MTNILNLCCGNDFYGNYRLDIYKTKATTHVADLEKGLPMFKNNFFTQVTIKCGLEHIKNIGLLADEIYRVLRPGGRLYIRTDYAGYLPLYLFASHEHNKALEVQYTKGTGYGHKKGKQKTAEIEDAHYHLFIESHLTKLFKKFRIRVYTYIPGGRNWLIMAILKLLPRHLGMVHIELEAIK